MEIRAEQLQIGYGDYIAVRDMDIQVKKGEITTIVAVSYTHLDVYKRQQFIKKNLDMVQ